jgi:uncharacterized protein (DUF885 family)
VRAVSTTLADLAAEYWHAYLAFRPVNATGLGERAYDALVEDRSPPARAAQMRRLDDLLARVRALRGEATADEETTRSALVEQIESDLAELACNLDDWTVDPLEGPQVMAFNIEAFQPIRTVAEGRDMVERWRRIGGWIDGHIANLRGGVGRGRVAVSSPVGRVVGTLDELLAEPDDAWALLNPARVEHPDWPPHELAAFRADLRDAVATGIRPALARLVGVLRDEILPAARPDDRPGISELAGGAEDYRRLVRVHTSLDLDPVDIHRTGLDEVERINAELVRLGERALGTRSGRRAEILGRLRADPALHFSTAEEIVASARAAVERARAVTPRWFGRQPRAACEVVEMGAHEAKDGTIAYYRQPAPDGSRPGQFFINTHAPETRPRYEAEALAYHEAVPGHHFQIAIAQELDGLPEFRRHLGTTAFWEGWGLYTERLSDEMGLYAGDVDRIGMLSLDAWRACRLVVDTGMHALGWTRQQAIDFMVENTALAENNIVNEVDRYIVWPAQALAYKTGQLELLRLRSEAQAALGDAFDIRAFHDAVLGDGALGLGTLARVVRAKLGLAETAQPAGTLTRRSV